MWILQIGLRRRNGGYREVMLSSIIDIERLGKPCGLNTIGGAMACITLPINMAVDFL